MVARRKTTAKFQSQEDHLSDKLGTIYLSSWLLHSLALAVNN